MYTRTGFLANPTKPTDAELDELEQHIKTYAKETTFHNGPHNKRRQQYFDQLDTLTLIRIRKERQRRKC